MLCPRCRRSTKSFRRTRRLKPTPCRTATMTRSAGLFIKLRVRLPLNRNDPVGLARGGAKAREGLYSSSVESEESNVWVPR